MPSKLNQLATRELVALFERTPSAVVIDFTGVGSEETYALRKALHGANISLRVVKGALARVALGAAGTKFDAGSFDGPVGLAFGDDPVAVVKALLAHRKGRKDAKLKLKGGYLDRNPLRPGEVTDLANMPSRQQMLGIVAGTFAAPLSSFVGVQAAIIRKLLYAVDAIRDKQEKGTSAA